jgi:hypothetical protein
VRTVVERSDLRALAEHEARLQASGGRELRDLVEYLAGLK